MRGKVKDVDAVQSQEPTILVSSFCRNAISLLQERWRIIWARSRLPFELFLGFDVLVWLWGTTVHRMPALCFPEVQGHSLRFELWIGFAKVER